MIKRYDISDSCGQIMIEEECGDWVSHEDHIKEVERLKGEIKHCIDFGLGFALCNSDHAGTRRGIKKAQNFLRELIGEPPEDV